MDGRAVDEPPHPPHPRGAHDHGGVTQVAVGGGLPDRGLLAVIALLVIAATIVSGSFLLRPTALHLPDCCEPWDAAIYPWNFFWLDAFADAPDGWLLFTKRFYWPDGEGFGLYTPTWVYGVLSLPFQWLLPEPQSRHVAVAFLLWFSSVATVLLAFRFARELGVPRVAAAFAALLVLAASGRVMNAARLNLFCTEFLLLWLWTAWRFWRDGGGGRAAAFGLASALLLLQSQPLFFQATLAGALFVAVALVRRAGRQQLVARARPFLLATALFLLLAGPFIWAVFCELPDSPAMRDSLALTQYGSLDVADLVRPNGVDRFASLTGQLLPRRDATFFESGGAVGTASHFLGLGWIALIALALVARDGGGARRSVGFALLLLLLAVGPVLKVDGEPLVPMPWQLLQLWPPLAIEKSPTRLVWLVQLFAALAAARALAWLAGEATARGAAVRRGAAVLLALATLAEQGDTVPLQSTAPALRIPDEIAAMAREPGDFAVLDVPFDGVLPHGQMAHGVNAFAMALGAAHERPIFFGLYPRAARPGLAALFARPLFAAMHQLEGGASVPALSPDQVTAMRNDLEELAVGAVIVHDFAVIPARAAEREPLRSLFRQLAPKSEQQLALGEGYTLTLFRF
ncbi:MAG: hypothetical protein EXS13_08605 [Planctomycetes bacterium]|nr:hypothetical protein [Planctomycetota bacterium]